MTLPTNIDASYPDRNAGDAAHQQHHDSVHAFYNKFDHTAAPAAGNTWVWDATAGVYKPGSGASAYAKFKTGQYYAPPAAALSTRQETEARVVMVPFVVDESATFDRVAVEVTAAGTAGAVVRLGIYGADADSMPGSLLVDAGTVDATTTGLKEAIISQAVTSGLYYLAAVVQGAATTRPTWRSVTGDSLLPLHTSGVTLTSNSINGISQSSVTGALPATATPDAGPGFGVSPRIVVRAA